MAARASDARGGRFCPWSATVTRIE